MHSRFPSDAEVVDLLLGLDELCDHANRLWIDGSFLQLGWTKLALSDEDAMFLVADPDMVQHGCGGLAMPKLWVWLAMDGRQLPPVSLFWLREVGGAFDVGLILLFGDWQASVLGAKGDGSAFACLDDAQVLVHLVTGAVKVALDFPDGELVADSLMVAKVFDGVTIGGGFDQVDDSGAQTSDEGVKKGFAIVLAVASSHSVRQAVLGVVKKVVHNVHHVNTLTLCGRALCHCIVTGGVWLRREAIGICQFHEKLSDGSEPEMVTNRMSIDPTSAGLILQGVFSTTCKIQAERSTIKPRSGRACPLIRRLQ